MNPTLVRETSSRQSQISEKMVAEVWKRQALKSPLRTTDGQSLEVIYGGRHCCDHGPDFRGALIALDGKLRRGDVEVHLRATDWRGHRHHLDQAYVDVILHVIMWPPGDPLPDKRNGETAPAFCIQQHIGISLGGMVTLSSTEHYGAFLCAARRAGADAIKANDLESDDLVLSIIDEAGDERLRHKAAAMEGDMSVMDPEEVLYRAIMAALGYTRNTTAFVQLAEIVPYSLLKAIVVGTHPDERPLTIRTLLLAKAGLLDDDEAAAERWKQLAEWDDGWRVRIPWRLGRTRPSNFPARRIAGAAAFLASVLDRGLEASIIEAIRTVEPDHVCRKLEAMVMVESTECGRAIGPERAAEIVANAVIPYALAMGESTEDEGFVKRTLAAFDRHKGFPENEISRYMAGLILDRRALPAARTARRQQGLLHLYKRWCADKRCAECPLGHLPQSS
jgi:hypothetical protein